jgi:hypothetical protein
MSSKIAGERERLPLREAGSAGTSARARALSRTGWLAWRSLGLGSVALLVSVVVFAGAYWRMWPLTVDIGAGDARFAHGFHEPERFGETLFRWTTGRSELDLPAPPAGAAVLTLRLLNGYPEGQPAPRLTLSADGRALGSFDVPRGTDGIRRYMLLQPVSERLTWPTHVVLESTTYSPAGDPRPLGVVLDWARLAPTRLAVAWPQLWLLVSAAALAALLYAAGLLASLGRGPALGIALVGPALLALGVALRPLETLPFVTRVAALPAIACLGLLAVRLLIPLERGLAGRRQLSGEHLPIVMAVAWWMLPVFQVVQIADGASIGLGNETLWIGGGLVVALVAVLGGWVLVRGGRTAAETRAAQIARLALIVLAAAALVHLIYMLEYAFTRSGKDFWILFKGARDWARGGSLYDLTAVETNHVGAVFKVPPFYGMLFTPFVFQDGLQILLYHRIINVALMLATGLVILRTWRVRPIWWGVALVTIIFNSRPLADTVAFGQIDLMLVLLLACALWALRAERDMLAGVLVALGTLFKIYPVILLAFFVLKGRWRALLGFALGMLIANGLAVAVMGWEMHRVYLFEVLPRIGGTTSWVENQTISAFLARLTDVPFEAHLFENRALALAGTLLSGLLSLLACWISLRPPRSDSTMFAMQYGQFLLLMVLAVPAAWMHYETLLVLVFAIVALHMRERAVPLPRALAFALGFALVSYGNQWSFNGTTSMGILTVLGVSYKFYGMLLLGAVMLEYLLEAPALALLPALGRLVPRFGQR